MAVWQPPRELPNLSGYRGTLYVDVETRDPGLEAKAGSSWPWGEGYVVGYALGVEDDEWYFPVAHEGGGNLPPAFGDCVVRLVESWDGEVSGFNLLYDVGWLRRSGVRTPMWSRTRDTLFGAALLDEDRNSYDLDSVARDCLGAGKDESLLRAGAESVGLRKPSAKAIKANLWRMHSSYVGPYAERDVALARELARWQASRLEADGLQDVYDLECDLIPLLVEMRAVGVRVDEQGASDLWERLMTRESALRDRALREFDVRVCGPRHAATIGQALDRLGIAYERTEKKGEAQVTDAWMKDHPHPFVALLREWRAANTLRTLCVEGIVLDHARGGRVYPELHPLRRDESEDGRRDPGGAVSGRFAGSRPNVLQAPARTEEGMLVRSFFLPEPGHEWHVFDYSQQEPRLMVHYSLLLGLTGAADFARRYSEEGADFHSITAETCGVPRKQAKGIGLGLAYTMGKKKMAATLGVPMEVALVYINDFHGGVPFVRELTQRCEWAAQETGWIKTLSGRRRRFELWEPDEFQRSRQKRPEALPRAEAEVTYRGRRLRRAFTYRAMNAVIQGSAADMTKRAVLALDRAGYRHLLRMIVHDEFDISLDDPRRAAEVVEIMRESTKLGVPVVVDHGSGDSWKAAKENADR